MDETALIGVDWGTTNARAFRYDAQGTVVETRHRGCGLLQIVDGDWETTFLKNFGDWTNGAPDLPVLLCGMVGSQQGWSEAPYVECPLDISTLAENLHPITGTDYCIVPGVRTIDGCGVPDVMRGEETQLAGLDPQGLQLVCLPGTHSKWVQIAGESVTGFQTYMTGELFKLLSEHSILARTQTKGPSSHEAFLLGVDHSKRDGGLLHQLFGVRGLRLFDQLTGDAQGDYLSGLLIGHEIRSALDATSAAGMVTVVGAKELTSRYVTAMEYMGRSIIVTDGEQAASRGLWRIAQQAGMIA
ncbi:MAG: 2-dehydro-3-deoxygalactonokinase [Planctomycetaceae bacterium]|nr:2-dehydro-3-deoxygalactonokinase [Planctomycetaceae bacterium]